MPSGHKLHKSAAQVPEDLAENGPKKAGRPERVIHDEMILLLFDKTVAQSANLINGKAQRLLQNFRFPGIALHTTGQVSQPNGHFINESFAVIFHGMIVGVIQVLHPFPVTLWQKVDKVVQEHGAFIFFPTTSDAKGVLILVDIMQP